MDENQLKYQIGLTLIKGVGPSIAKKLISAFSNAEEIFKTPRQKLENIPGIGKILSQQITHPEILCKAEKEIQFIKKNNITTLFYSEDAYPFRLKECNDSPIILYKKGNASFNEKKYLGIVGTRKMTSYGKQHCENIISELAQRHPDLIIVSGLAYGVDICAHKKALDSNLQTIGIIGHGLDCLYPSSHQQIANRMLSQGALLTEYTSETNIDRNNFVARNRIIAGMCDLILVIESGEKGGALLTAEFANSYNRDVGAIQGRTNDIYSIGCNSLIKRNKAAMIENANDIEMLMNWDTISKPNHQLSLFSELPDKEQSIIQFLQENGTVHIDILTRELHIPTTKISALLLNLEFKGLIRCLPGASYIINNL